MSRQSSVNGRQTKTVTARGDAGKIESRVIALDGLKPHPRNYNRHPDSQIADITESLQQFGLVKPIVIWREFIIAGHGVALAACKLGWDKIEARVLPSAWRESKALAYLAADNELARHGDPDQQQLAAIVADVAKAEGEALAKLAAGDAKALRALLAQASFDSAQDADPADLIDRAAELQKKWQCAKGDIWTAAGHFWICGDCRDAETWARLLKAAGVNKVNGVFTSPPYAEQRKKQYGGVPTDKYVEWWEAVQANVRANLAGDGSFFVNIKPHCENGERVLYVFDLVLAMKRKWGWRFVDEFCWKKSGYPTGLENRLKNSFEPIFLFSVIGKHKARFENVTECKTTRVCAAARSLAESQGRGQWGNKIISSARPDNVLEIAFDSTGISADGHAARFPVALPTFFVKAYSDAGDVWCDPFLGSGTTIVAAHKQGRRGLGIEQLEKYTAVICARIEKETGETPRRVTASASAERAPAKQARKAGKTRTKAERREQDPDRA